MADLGKLAAKLIPRRPVPAYGGQCEADFANRLLDASGLSLGPHDAGRLLTLLVRRTAAFWDGDANPSLSPST